MAGKKPSALAQLNRWRQLHIHNCIDSLKGFAEQPVATILTIAVIGIALALPASLNLVVQNGRNLAGNWDNARDFSVYLSPGSSSDQAQQIADELNDLDSIDSVMIILADTAMDEFKESSGLGEILDTLEENPLPHTLVVRPEESTSVEMLEAISADLISRPVVELVKIDTEWVARLNAILEFLRRIVLMGSVLLIAAVIIITGNTIRLDIQSKRDEIEVVKLLGASDGFVRRPFLYIGLWYGLLGGAFALLLLLIGGWVMAGPLERLLGLYDTRLDLLGMNTATVLFVVGGGILAGWGGAWTAVTRHLSAIQPK